MEHSELPEFLAMLQFHLWMMLIKEVNVLELLGIWLIILTIIVKQCVSQLLAVALQGTLHQSQSSQIT